MRALRARKWVGYVVAIAAVAAAAGVRMALGGLLAEAPFITFYPAIAVTTAVGGGRGGLLCLVLSIGLANYLFLPPYNAFGLTAPDLVATLLFLAVSGMIIAVIAMLNEAIDRLWRQEADTRSIMEALPTGVIAVDSEGKIVLANAAVGRLLGYATGEMLGRQADDLTPERDHYFDRREPRAMGAGGDFQAIRKDGSLVAVEIGLNPYERGGRAGALATIADISERKQLEARNEVLAREVKHRANNLLTVIQALARRTLSGPERPRFLDILGALGRTHQLLEKASSATLGSLIEAELVTAANHVEVIGCHSRLPPDLAQDFTLILHELTINSLKYGALSAASGRVNISGQPTGDSLYRFIWEEKDGPTVETPSRRGFGSTILGQVARGFATEVIMDFAAAGLRYELSFPLARIELVGETAGG